MGFREFLMSFDPDQPRDENGRWASSGGGGSASGGRAGGTYTRPPVVRVETVEEGVAAILRGETVELPDVASVHTALSRLAAIAEDAKAKGERAPKYDLCRVTVPGTSLFCASGLRTAEYPNGVPRLEMPQLAGPPVPGSAADALPKSKNGSVNAAEQFTQHLTGLGIATERGTTIASHLRASQAQLDGPTVAGMMTAKGYDPGKEPIFISRDNYVVDGHHRWAAVVGRDAAKGALGELRMNTVRIDAPISEILHIANKWSREFGIAGKTVNLSLYRQKLWLISQPNAAALIESFELREYERNRCGQFGSDDSTCPGEGGSGGGGEQSSKRGPTSEASLRNDPALVKRAEEIIAKATYPAEKENAIWIAAGERQAGNELTNGDTMTRFTNAKGEFTPERLAIHSTLIKDVINSAPTGQERPVAIFSAGLPGAGKSTGLATVPKQDYVMINADEFKERLPEYRGSNAGELHEESSYLADKTFRVAIAQRQNLIFDSTMKTLGTKGDSYEENKDNGGVARKIADLKAAGYIIDVRFADVTVNTSIDRVMKRYSEAEERDGTGRFVPPAVVKSAAEKQWGTKPRKTFEAIKNVVDRWTITDNNGRAPVVVDSKR